MSNNQENNILNNQKKQLSPFLSKLFYLYFAILPLLAFASLYFEKNVWSDFSKLINPNNTSLYFVYHIFCAAVFFLTAILSLLLIKNTPLPKKKLLAFIMIFDAPVILLIDALTGHKISFAEMAIFDFTIELSAFMIADIILSFTKKEHTILLPATIFTIALLISYYGVFTFNILMQSSIKSLILFSFTFVSAIIGYFNVLKSAKSGKTEYTNDHQVYMAKVGTLAMFATWALIAFVYLITFMNS